MTIHSLEGDPVELWVDEVSVLVGELVSGVDEEVSVSAVEEGGSLVVLVGGPIGLGGRGAEGSVGVGVAGGLSPAGLAGLQGVYSSSTSSSAMVPCVADRLNVEVKISWRQ